MTLLEEFISGESRHKAPDPFCMLKKGEISSWTRTYLPMQVPNLSHTQACRATPHQSLQFAIAMCLR